MAARIIITAKTAAETTDRITLTAQNTPCSFTAIGLASGEDIVFEFGDGAGNWETAQQNGATVALKDTNQNQGIYGPCEIRFVKPTSAGAAGVTWHVKDDA